MGDGKSSGKAGAVLKWPSFTELNEASEFIRNVNNVHFFILLKRYLANTIIDPSAVQISSIISFGNSSLVTL